MTIIHHLKAGDLRIDAQPLTMAGFAPFGDVIENIAAGIDPSKSDGQPPLPPNASIANQGSAVKLSNVSYMNSHYQSAPSQSPSRTSVSMFVCHPRSLRDLSHNQSAFDIQILERHPYTTQSFVPMGLSKVDSDTFYLVIVAPSLPASPGDPESRGAMPRSLGKPDLEHLHAFIANGAQAVTYGAAVWHAPMVAIGTKPIDFVVYQFANGEAAEDCQEVVIAPLQPNDAGPCVIMSDSSFRQAQPRGKL